MRYRYAYDKSGLTFSEPEWIALAYERFDPSVPTLAGFIFDLTHVFEKHLRANTIVQVDDPDDTVIAPPNKPIGCPACHHIHHTDKHGWVYPFINHPTYYSSFSGWRY